MFWWTLVFLGLTDQQDEQLYVSDPRALQSIIQKDQDAFEETAVFVEYVIFPFIGPIPQPFLFDS